MPKVSKIELEITLDDNKVPEKIEWKAPDGGVDKAMDTKAFMLSIWDTNENAALRIDLWTKKMMVDDMNDFFYQTIMTMADTYERATTHKHLAAEIRTFSTELKKKMENEMKKNQL